MPVKSSLLRFVLRTALHLLVALALYGLYAPLNPHPNNITGSSIQFVYQQF
ncbi:MAG: hypothetical protein JNL88_07225 [Bacteroidia bacterium]|nr:hypothetical protein [Bacteroidia bacterium]